MGKQFANVSSKRGAPMGRHERAVSPDNMPAFKSLALFRVKLDSGGYDDGGAYWGIGKPLFCLRGNGDNFDVQLFVRAKTRNEAIDVFKVNPDLLKKANSGIIADKRYTVGLECYGAITPGYVLRFCGTWVDAFETRELARLAALKHRENRMNEIEKGGAL